MGFRGHWTIGPFYVSPMTTALARPPYFTVADVDLGLLRELIAERTDPGRYPHAQAVVGEVVVYDMLELAPILSEWSGRHAVMAELADVLSDGPGVLCLRHAVARDVLDRTTAAFERILAEQARSGGGVGDHFAAAGANGRVWNAVEKLAVGEPDVFVDYYAADAIALAAGAWLGPGYQVTSQLNVVRPGGAAQAPHRDFVLGFMSDAQAAVYPAHVHTMSPQLTLQGAIAHVDMPVASGPTKLLPHSQKLPDGYLAWRRPDVVELFEEHHVQLPLDAGDAVFFNPALFHAAGSNHTAAIHRMANLLQIVSPFGRAMESVDRARVVRALYPVLLGRAKAGADRVALANVVAASAEGYPFPTNLDRDPPIDGLAPPSQADLVWRALTEQWPVARLDDALDHAAFRRWTT